ADTAEVEGAQHGETITFKVAGAASAETASWQTGGYGRQDLTVPSGADITVTIDDGVTAAYPTETLSYNLNVENRSAATATGVVLEVTLPEHVTLVSTGGGTVSGRLLTWPGVELAGGATLTRSVSVQVATTFPQGTESIVASARVHHDGASGIDPDPSNDNAGDADALRVPPDFAIAATDVALSPAQPAAGQSANVTLAVHNPGFIDGTALVVLYDGPAGTGTLIGSQVVTVAAGGTATVTTSFVVSASTVVISAVVDPDNDVVEVDERNNAAQKFLADVPDLAVGVDNVTVVPASPRAGEAVTVSVTVRNAGRTAASSVPLAVYDGEPEHGGTLVLSETSAALSNAANRTISVVWTPAEGLHQLTIVLDEPNQVLEISEENNRVTKAIDIARTAGPDLVVAGLDLAAFSQSSATLVASGTVRATVHNAGTADVSTPVAVRIFEDRDGSGGFGAGDRELGRQTLAGALAAGASSVASLAVQSGLEFFHAPLLVEVDP
ncbi:MAG: CARDB domain-containing protein, partial [bacterium]